MRLATCAACILINVGAAPGQPSGNTQSDEHWLRELALQGVEPGRIVGADRSGIPRICGIGLGGKNTQVGAVPILSRDLPIGTRGWACVPGVIRNNGVDSFRLEVDVNGSVGAVRLDNLSNLLVPPGPPPLNLVDSGVGLDVIAGDGISTAGPFRFNSTASMPEFYMNDPASPAGLALAAVGRVTITETDGSETTFLIRPEVGLLHEDIPTVNVRSSTTDVVTTPHLINIRSTTNETQQFLRLLGGDLPSLTTRIYASLPDTFDFIVFLSAGKIELLPRTSASNFIAGIHVHVQTNYSGTGLAPSGNTALFGSGGRLLSVNVVDALGRGLAASNVAHELLHQWSSYTSLTLGLSDGTGHYNSRTSASSLVGGFEWIDNLNGTFTLNCEEGRNGARNASPIDRYMMGIAGGETVPALHANAGITFPTDCGANVVSLLDVTIGDIQALHGSRAPGPTGTPTSFNVAFVVETFERLLGPTELTFYDALAEHFAAAIPPEAPSPRLAENWPPVGRFFDGTTWRTAIHATESTIPTVGGWSMAVMALLILASGTATLSRRLKSPERAEMSAASRKRPVRQNQ